MFRKREDLVISNFLVICIHLVDAKSWWYHRKNNKNTIKSYTLGVLRGRWGREKIFLKIIYHCKNDWFFRLWMSFYLNLLCMEGEKKKKIKWWCYRNVFLYQSKIDLQPWCGYMLSLFIFNVVVFCSVFACKVSFLLSFAYFPTIHYRLTFWSVSLEECKIIPFVNVQSQDKDKSEDFLGDIELSLTWLNYEHYLTLHGD